jgi:hypothetical protein
MDPYTNWLDSLWCLAFSLTSRVGWLWFCRGAGVAV